MPPPPRPAMLLSVPLLLGLLGLAAADPAIYFKEQFLDGGKVWARLEAASATAGPRALGWLVVCNVITVQRANTVAPGGLEPRAVPFVRPWGTRKAQRFPAPGVRVRSRT